MEMFIEALKALFTEWLPTSSPSGPPHDPRRRIREAERVSPSFSSFSWWSSNRRHHGGAHPLRPQAEPLLVEEDVRPRSAARGGCGAWWPSAASRRRPSDLRWTTSSTSISTTRGRWRWRLSSTASCSSCWSVATSARGSLSGQSRPRRPAAPMRVRARGGSDGDDGDDAEMALFRVRTVDDIDWKTALKIGCFQMLAIVPGTSRFGLHHHRRHALRLLAHGCGGVHVLPGDSRHARLGRAEAHQVS